MEEFTVEVRDGRNVPRVLARVRAPDLATAMITAFADPNAANWVFLHEVSGDELAWVLDGHPGDG